MRPAQIAREIVSSQFVAGRRVHGFNEARANCAGNYAQETTMQRRAGRLQ